jgi:FkbM family methyltransferase
MRSKLVGALHHPTRTLRALPAIAAARIAAIRQARRVPAVSRMVRAAYAEPRGSQHRILLSSSRRWYGLEAADAASRKRAGQLNSDTWLAQTSLFEQGLKLELGVSPIGSGDLQVHCSSGDVIESQIFLRGFYEELTVLQLYPELMLPGSSAIDVGANIGLHTLVMASLAGGQPPARVFAYEPRPSIVRRLQENLELNHLADRVIVRQIGLWSEAGRIHFNQEDQNFNQGGGRYDPASDFLIDVTSLDADRQGLGDRVGVIKIDVEGAELQVLQGAQQTLAAHRPAIILEHNSPPWTLLQVRAAIPYAVEIIRIPNTLHERPAPIQDDAQLHGYNNLLLRPR